MTHYYLQHARKLRVIRERYRRFRNAELRYQRWCVYKVLE